MTAEIRTFSCLTDNFGYLIHDPVTKATASIDAPEAGPIIKALEREVRELRQANEILRKASAYFAQAELDRPFRK